MTKLTMTNKCTLSAGRFDGHGSAPEQFRWYRPMRHDQGYSRSHWMPASSDYSLRITPASARTTGKQTTINKYTNKAGRFDGHRDAAVRYRAHHMMEEDQGFTRSLDATIGRELAPIASNQTYQHRFCPMFFIIKLSKKPQNHKDSP
jgi:hypothetical protein